MDQTRNILYFVAIAALIIITGMVQSWNSALLILNMGLISAVMALGVNLQWGFAGLFNVGVMGFVALGGLAAVLVSTDPVSEAWNAGGLRILFALAVGVGIIGATIIAYRRITATRPRLIAMVTILGLGFFAYRALLDPAVEAVEAVNPALQGNLGGLGLPIILAWPVGGLFAAGAATSPPPSTGSRAGRAGTPWRAWSTAATSRATRIAGSTPCPRATASASAWPRPWSTTPTCSSW